jgi:hypothetical protein
LGDLFSINSSKKIFHANQISDIFDEQRKTTFRYVVRTTQNNGIRGYIAEDEKYLNDGNTLSFAQDTFSVFYQKERYFTGNKVKVLKAKFENTTEKVMKYLTVSFQKSLSKSTWGLGSTIETIGKTKIQLPTKNGEIDFDFMENFISQIEAERIEKVQNYLDVTGLKNYNLTKNEKEVLEEFQNGKVKWSEFKIGDLFEKLKTKKLPFKAVELPKEETDEYTLPCLTSSFQNQGLNYFVPKDNATILKNVISIPSNSDVYRAYFQSREFTVLSDAYVIDWISNEQKMSNQNSLFVVSSINKVTDLKIYSYKNKLGGWNIVKEKYIQLPTLNNQPDYEKMETLISAIQKNVIKNVVDFSFKK